MRQKSNNHKDAADRTVKDIRRRTRKTYSAEEKIRIVLAGLRGEESQAHRLPRPPMINAATLIRAIRFMILLLTHPSSLLDHYSVFHSPNALLAQAGPCIKWPKT